jgi:hypothetical protein
MTEKGDNILKDETVNRQHTLRWYRMGQSSIGN